MHTSRAGTFIFFIKKIGTEFAGLFDIICWTSFSFSLQKTFFHYGPIWLKNKSNKSTIIYAFKVVDIGSKNAWIFDILHLNCGLFCLPAFIADSLKSRNTIYQKDCSVQTLFIRRAPFNLNELFIPHALFISRILSISCALFTRKYCSFFFFLKKFGTELADLFATTCWKKKLLLSWEDTFPVTSNMAEN